MILFRQSIGAYLIKISEWLEMAEISIGPAKLKMSLFNEKMTIKQPQKNSKTLNFELFLFLTVRYGLILSFNCIL